MLVVSCLVWGFPVLWSKTESSTSAAGQERRWPELLELVGEVCLLDGALLSGQMWGARRGLPWGFISPDVLTWPPPNQREEA